MSVRYSYLYDQFKDANDLWEDLKKFVATGDFTLGEPLQRFEKSFAEIIGTKYSVGVNSGTDAIKLSLKAAGVKPGDHVITAANTFVATVGAITEIGCIPVFVDCDDTFCIDANKIEDAITENTTAIVPVHFTGYVADMEKIMTIAEKHSLVVVEDACQSILGTFKGQNAGTFGLTGAFSLHPLKNLNVWSDGGIICTDDTEIYKKLNLLRNHGLVDRDTVGMLGYNSRLDTIQAVVGNWLIPQTQSIANQRRENARYLDIGLSKIQQVRIPERIGHIGSVFHLYIVFAENRDELLKHCLSKGLEAKVHYPVPIYKQPALREFVDPGKIFPVTDWHAQNIITFPCDQHLTKSQLDEIIKIVSEFYKK